MLAAEPNTTIPDIKAATITLFNELLVSKKWTYSHTHKDVNIALADSPSNFSLPIIKGDAFFTDQFTKLEWLSVANNPEARKFWDARFDGAEVLEAIGEGDLIIHSIQKGQLMVSARELLTLTTQYYGQNGDLCYFAVSINGHNKYVSGKGKVLANLGIAGWCFSSETRDGVEGLKVTYMVDVNINGYVPSSLIKIVQAQTPQCVETVHNYLTKYGTTAFLLKTLPEDSEFRLKNLIGLREKRNSKNEDVEVNMKVVDLKKNSLLSIYIPDKKSFKDGFKVENLNFKNKVDVKFVKFEKDKKEFKDLVSKSCLGFLVLDIAVGELENLEFVIKSNTGGNSYLFDGKQVNLL
ncbi:hypothetical protein HK099_001330 [Clydaea vesicula]|uniref:START domain-containing protein n=1 Tax=Clydaea vesicula TaxID=447962 RepID=A0AAD5TWG8_9FUNG|nr:hypothetical protein HK099_001330 [Clydaea vesicula]KAJ3381792.1 hypothetical protein HDU92_005115 [Lobulomyces angularis]